MGRRGRVWGWCYSGMHFSVCFLMCKMFSPQMPSSVTSGGRTRRSSPLVVKASMLYAVKAHEGGGPLSSPAEGEALALLTGSR